MTLTHDEIAGMTCEQVNVAIAIRRGEEVTKPVGFLADSVSQSDVTGSTGSTGIRALFLHPDYCHDWSHAGRLLEMMTGEASGVPDLIWLGNKWVCYACDGKFIIGDVVAPTAPEAIARCFLEWWEVTHKEVE